MKVKPKHRQFDPAIKKRINMALQGGGAHGAFGWGVMDKFLEDGRVEIEGLSGTSAGSMNAVVYAYGKLKGNDGAREALHNFWKAISDAGQRFAPPKLPWDIMPHQKENPIQDLMKSMMAMFSPYQTNPMNFNPLRDVLNRSVDFERLEDCRRVKLFISASNVKTGKVRVFRSGEITPDALLKQFNGVPEAFGADPRPKKLEWMIRQARSVAGR